MWQPLEALIGPTRCDDFMYMGPASNGAHQYKNVNTRRYLVISENGATFKYLHMAGSYVAVSHKEALEHVFS